MNMVFLQKSIIFWHTVIAYLLATYSQFTALTLELHEVTNIMAKMQLYKFSLKWLGITGVSILILEFWSGMYNYELGQ